MRAVSRVTVKAPDRYPELTLLADWNGAAARGHVPSVATREQLAAVVTAGFGGQVRLDALRLDAGRRGEAQLRRLAPFIPELSQVRELRLESSGAGFTVWGRVDRPERLGRILTARAALGLEQLVRSRIRVSPARAAPRITLFSDRRQAVISGTLPSTKAKERLLADLPQALGTTGLVDLISVEPDVAHAPWLERWGDILTLLPQKIIGLSIDADRVLISGNLDSAEQQDRVSRELAALLSEFRLLDWTTAAP